eukprot:TRINITY_DN3239_c0_g1_i1.p1 TRINITY_DN3239_c0_g1~~TRINITY_DN3239_c0_g1_i1.p1  ORF type:complete len:130 (-),score=23.22 TRINITY_DN3239_c0_g1_i1:59-448(-)
MAPMKKTGKKAKKVSHAFTIDCTHPVEDGIMQIGKFEEFLKGAVKVEGKTGNLGKNVAISSTKTKIQVNADIDFSKRYLKYLSKKYLKANNLRDWLRVVADSKASYQLKYFNINQDEEEERKNKARPKK